MGRTCTRGPRRGALPHLLHAAPRSRCQEERDEEEVEEEEEEVEEEEKASYLA